jgi:hypothetical protein
MSRFTALGEMASTLAHEKVRASFGEDYQRLRELKAKFDPTNFFRMNANIPSA